MGTIKITEIQKLVLPGDWHGERYGEIVVVGNFTQGVLRTIDTSRPNEVDSTVALYPELTQALGR